MRIAVIFLITFSGIAFASEKSCNPADHRKVTELYHATDLEEAFEAGKTIQTAIRQKDIDKLYSFIDSETVGAPKKQEVIDKGFSTFFDDTFVASILEEKLPCVLIIGDYYALGEIAFELSYASYDSDDKVAKIAAIRLRGADSNCTLKDYAITHALEEDGDPEEAFEMGRRIQKAFREKDIDALYSLMRPSSTSSSEKQKVVAKGFSTVLGEGFVKAVIEATPPCLPFDHYGTYWLPGVSYDFLYGGWRIYADDLKNLPQQGPWFWNNEAISSGCLKITSRGWAGIRGRNSTLWANAGQYYGNSISLSNPHLIGELPACNDRREAAYERSTYSVLKKVSSLLCEELAPHIESSCKASVFTKDFHDTAARGVGRRLYRYTEFNIYGLFEIDGTEKILLLKEFKSKSAGREFIDQWEADNL